MSSSREDQFKAFCMVAGSILAEWRDADRVTVRKTADDKAIAELREADGRLMLKAEIKLTGLRAPRRLHVVKT